MRRQQPRAPGGVGLRLLAPSLQLGVFAPQPGNCCLGRLAGARRRGRADLALTAARSTGAGRIAARPVGIHLHAVAAARAAAIAAPTLPATIASAALATTVAAAALATAAALAAAHAAEATHQPAAAPRVATSPVAAAAALAARLVLQVHWVRAFVRPQL